jgi:predicted metal-dependent hydrolase
VLEKADFIFEGRLKDNVIKERKAPRFTALCQDKVAAVASRRLAYLSITGDMARLRKQ